MEVQKDAWNSKEQMAIMDKYDRVVAYLYSIAQSMPRKHGDDVSLRRFIASWSGHAGWADSHNLLNWMENRYGISDYQLAS
jgi:hypothetical protein